MCQTSTTLKCVAALPTRLETSPYYWSQPHYTERITAAAASSANVASPRNHKHPSIRTQKAIVGVVGPAVLLLMIDELDMGF